MPPGVSTPSGTPSPSVSAFVGSVPSVPTSRPSDRPSPSVSGLSGSVPDVPSLPTQGEIVMEPSHSPSPSVSGLVRLVPLAASLSVQPPSVTLPSHRPSPSESISSASIRVSPSVSTGLPPGASVPSGIPSPSVSGFVGIVWRSRYSTPSGIPSWSVSGSSGSVPAAVSLPRHGGLIVSEPSHSPSPSVSAEYGLVPSISSCVFEMPSLSASVNVLTTVVLSTAFESAPFVPSSEIWPTSTSVWTPFGIGVFILTA